MEQALLDRLGFDGLDVDALAAVRCEQSAQHADGGGLAGAVGTEKAVDRAATDLHRQVAHHDLAVEGLGQARITSYNVCYTKLLRRG